MLDMNAHGEMENIKIVKFSFCHGNPGFNFTSTPSIICQQATQIFKTFYIFKGVCLNTEISGPVNVIHLSDVSGIYYAAATLVHGK